MERLIQVEQVVKDFRGLRPLRVQAFELLAGESVALLGFDQALAEVLVNLLTGAVLPDTGAVTVFGTPTHTIVDADAWVATLDRFGLISERAVMLDGLTTEQNLALPLTLTVETLSAEVRSQVRGIAEEVGLAADELAAPAATLSPLGRQRLRLGRALALGPRVLLAEHPNAPLSGADTETFARQVGQVVAGRGLAALVITADPGFARAITGKVLTLQPATGALKADPRWRRWLP